MINCDNRPWGRWEEYLHEPGYKVKRILVQPGKRFSLQRHEKRSEYWVIVYGKGKLTLNGAERIVTAGDTAFIDIGDIHRIENVGTEYLIFIETQLGICLEDDIIRLEDDWGRQ